MSAQREGFSAWRGGIGITFGQPSRRIPDVTEFGYEIVWGAEDPRAVKALDIATFRYINMIVEISLKGEGYDFSDMADKDAAATLAFDAWAERQYGEKGLSKHATVRYVGAEKSYGDVYGVCNMASDNALVRAIIGAYLRELEREGIRYGGIALDNAGKVPLAFVQRVHREFAQRGYDIASNGAPEELFPYITLFGNEGHHYTPEFARWLRAQGHETVLIEFAMRQLSPGGLEQFLVTKHMNGVVFFGYTDGSIAASVPYSFYTERPDIYEFHRAVLRKYVPISRAIRAAGWQSEPHARPQSLPLAVPPKDDPRAAAAAGHLDADGKVIERDHAARRREAEKRGIVIARHGDDLAQGVYLYLDAPRGDTICVDAAPLDIDKDTVVFDEFEGRLLRPQFDGETLRFRGRAGQDVVQLGSAQTVARNLLGRLGEMLRTQLKQRSLDRKLGPLSPLKPWRKFCEGYELDHAVRHSGRSSIRLDGGLVTYLIKWKRHHRRGAAQHVTVDQQKPTPLVLELFGKADGVPRSKLKKITARRRWFNQRKGWHYCAHLYLDYGDGAWPKVHTIALPAGTYGWRKERLRVVPRKAVKSAMVLLELHQPAGTAWFDDVSLVEGSTPKLNLLEAPGFEWTGRDERRAAGLSKEYEGKVRALVRLLVKARRAKRISPVLVTAQEEAATLERWMEGRRVVRLWGRETRDLREVQDRIALVLRILL